MMEGLVEAFGLTLGLWISCLIIAFAVSFFLLFFTDYRILKTLFQFMRIYFHALRATPAIFQLIGFYSIMGVLFPGSWVNSAFMCALISLGINCTAYLFSAFEEAKRNYKEKDTLSVFGFSKIDQFFVFEVPYVWKNCRYSVLNAAILLLKTTSLSSIITLHEMTSWAKERSSETFDFWVPYIAIAGIYVFLYWIIRILMGSLQVIPSSAEG